jgi:hypothetical protein
VRARLELRGDGDEGSTRTRRYASFLPSRLVRSFPSVSRSLAPRAPFAPSGRSLPRADRSDSDCGAVARGVARFIRVPVSHANGSQRDRRSRQATTSASDDGVKDRRNRLVIGIIVANRRFSEPQLGTVFDSETTESMNSYDNPYEFVAHRRASDSSRSPLTFEATDVTHSSLRGCHTTVPIQALPPSICSIQRMHLSVQAAY